MRPDQDRRRRYCRRAATGVGCRLYARLRRSIHWGIWRGRERRDRGGWFHATTPKIWIDVDDDEATMPVVKSPESIFIVVAGGPGRHHLVIPTTGDLTECVTRPITFKDGKPIKSVHDFTR